MATNENPIHVDRNGIVAVVACDQSQHFAVTRATFGELTNLSKRVIWDDGRNIAAFASDFYPSTSALFDGIEKLMHGRSLSAVIGNFRGTVPLKKAHQAALTELNNLLLTPTVIVNFKGVFLTIKKQKSKPSIRILFDDGWGLYRYAGNKDLFWLSNAFKVTSDPQKDPLFRQAIRVAMVMTEPFRAARYRLAVTAHWPKDMTPINFVNGREDGPYKLVPIDMELFKSRGFTL